LDSAQVPRQPNRPTASASDRLRRGALRGFVGWYWALVGDGVCVRGIPDAGATAAMRSLTDRFAVDAHLRRREVDEFLAIIGAA
jgi:hypothetical protein